jgi:hypothetical protein
MPAKIAEDLYEYQVGDVAWIHVGGHEAVKGTVVAVVNLASHGRQYIIATPTGIDDILEVRSGYIPLMRPINPKVQVIADLIDDYLAKIDFPVLIYDIHSTTLAALILEDL